jgi:sodium/potassium-transporting ATPase subunit alpha
MYLGIVLAIVVCLTSVFAWYQESSSAAIMEGFKKFLPTIVSAVREGRQLQVKAETLVPGDIIKVNMGGKLPADIRVIEASNDLLANNSSLTGESEPQERGVEAGHDVVMEAKNLCFFGTQIVQGNCTGVVINTADHTMMGRIAALADDTQVLETPLQREIKLFIHKIAIFAIVLGVIFFVIGFIIGRAPIENLVFAIGIIVANVPEGLLSTVTVALTITAKRMAAKNVLVKNLEAVETLGSTTCICSDKTGTLTMNVSITRSRIATASDVPFSHWLSLCLCSTGDDRRARVLQLRHPRSEPPQPDGGPVRHQGFHHATSGACGWFVQQLRV